MASLPSRAARGVARAAARVISPFLLVAILASPPAPALAPTATALSGTGTYQAGASACTTTVLLSIAPSNGAASELAVASYVYDPNVATPCGPVGAQYFIVTGDAAHGWNGASLPLPDLALWTLAVAPIAGAPGTYAYTAIEISHGAHIAARLGVATAAAPAGLPV